MRTFQTVVESMALITTYNALPIAIERGEGAWLWDTEGKQYLDAYSGVSTSCLGHAHPALLKAIREQSEKVIHTGNGVTVPQQLALAEKLSSLTGMEQAFFGNSGAEAVEAAIKLARLYGHKRNIETPSIIVTEGAFHGRTMAALTASANRKGQAGFEPLLPGFIRAPYNDIPALEAIAKNSQDVVAILVEPIQGESGINIPANNYLNDVRDLCNNNEWLMMLDEVQTGNGRTGKLYAYEHNGIVPDVMTTAKGLGGGFPIGACLMRGAATDLFQPGNHGSTFGGSPLACHVANTVIDTIIHDKLADNAAKMGDVIVNGLQAELASNPHVKDIRGKGLLIGIELDQPSRELLTMGLKHGLLFNVTADTVARILPPLIINQEQAEQIVTRMTAAISEFTG